MSACILQRICSAWLGKYTKSLLLYTAWPITHGVQLLADHTVHKIHVHQAQPETDTWGWSKYEKQPLKTFRSGSVALAFKVTPRLARHLSDRLSTEYDKLHKCRTYYSPDGLDCTGWRNAQQKVATQCWRRLAPVRRSRWRAARRRVRSVDVPPYTNEVSLRGVVLQSRVTLLQRWRII